MSRPPACRAAGTALFGAVLSTRLASELTAASDQAGGAIPLDRVDELTSNIK